MKYEKEDVWKIILKFPQIACLGGAPRDTRLNKPVRDYDLYIPYDTWPRVLEHLGVRRNANYIPLHPETGDWLIDEFDSGIGYTHDYIEERLQLDNLDLIRLCHRLKPAKVMSQFNASISQIGWFAYTGEIVERRTTACIRDINRRTITIYDKGYGPNAYEEFAAKLKAKYPDWQMVYAKFEKD